MKLFSLVLNMDVEQFIAEIEKYPIIYNKKIKDYSNKILKSDTWKKIYEKFIENYGELDNPEKEKKVIVFCYTAMR